MSGLTLTVHRATDQIGGNCIELATGEGRILLDVGRPLDAPKGATGLLPETLDLSRPVDGVLISHPHQDHYGLLDELVADVVAPAQFEHHGVCVRRTGDMEKAEPATADELVGVAVQPVFEIGEHVALPAHMSGRFLGCLKTPDFEDVHIGGREEGMREVTHGVGK